MAIGPVSTFVDTKDPKVELQRSLSHIHPLRRGCSKQQIPMVAYAPGGMTLIARFSQLMTSRATSSARVLSSGPTWLIPS